MDFAGTIIEESLENSSILRGMKILSTEVEKVEEGHKSPWLTKWTLHKIEIPEADAEAIAEKLSHVIDRAHSGNWYADFKTDSEHYIVYRNKVFHVTDRSDKAQYDVATAYGISIGIPSYQVDFSPHIKLWQR